MLYFWFVSLSVFFVSLFLCPSVCLSIGLSPSLSYYQRSGVQAGRERERKTLSVGKDVGEGAGVGRGGRAGGRAGIYQAATNPITQDEEEQKSYNSCLLFSSRRQESHSPDAADDPLSPSYCAPTTSQHLTTFRGT